MSAHLSPRDGSEGGACKPGLILIVDDVHDEAKLAGRIVAAVYPGRPVRIVHSGKALGAYLKGEGTYADRSEYPLPAAILLDLKMPEMDGFSVLEWLAADANFAHIPVVVLSGFSELSNLKRAYSLRARAYLIKPVEEHSLRSVLSSLNLGL
jgi:CheY-like chemotaxis protein